MDLPASWDSSIHPLTLNLAVGEVPSTMHLGILATDLSYFGALPRGLMFSAFSGSLVSAGRARKAKGKTSLSRLFYRTNPPLRRGFCGI